MGGLQLTDAEADQYSAALDALWTALRGRETLSRRYVERALQVAILEACDPKQQDPGTLFQDRLVKAGDRDAPLREKILHIAEAQAETVIQPNGMTDNLRGKAVSMVAGNLALHHPTLPLAPPS